MASGTQRVTRREPRPFFLGCLAGIVPWAAIGTYLAGPGASLHPPGFVYAIFGSLFVAFNDFALNQWLQYRQVGRRRNDLVGERAYVTLSLVAKSLFAWQIFASRLASTLPRSVVRHAPRGAGALGAAPGGSETGRAPATAERRITGARSLTTASAPRG